MTKHLLTAVIIILVLILALAGWFYSRFEATPAEEQEWGVTFSRPHAEYLGFDWKTIYLDTLNDLQPKHLRLVAYWEFLEAEPDLWFFQDINEMLDEAQRRDIQVILTIGHKVPRWPECHHPVWYNDLPEADKQTEQLEMIEMTVNYFKHFDNIKIWQIENEPLFDFGENCPPLDPEFVKQEIELVRSLDDRPVMLTDSGELGRWIPTAKLNPDILGSTMYRVVHNPKIGYFSYPLPPAFFRVKAGLTQTFTDVDQFLGVELQAEPWFSDDVQHTDLQTQLALMNPKIFADNVAYAERAGFRQNYLWGVEWWYYLAHVHNDWGMWETAKNTLK